MKGGETVLPMYWWWVPKVIPPQAISERVEGFNLLTNGVHPVSTYMYFQELMDVKVRLIEDKTCNN